MLRFVLGMLFFFGLAAEAGAQSIPVVDSEYSIGKQVSGSVRIGNAHVALPPGNFTVAVFDESESTGSAAIHSKLHLAWLVQTVDGRLNRAILLESNTGNSLVVGWNRNKEICDRKDVHHNLSDQNYSINDALCWSVNHYTLTRSSTTSKTTAAFYDFTDKINRPATALVNAFHIVKDDSFLRAIYYQNPETEGFYPAKQTWQMNDWHHDRILGDSKRVAYVSAVKAEGEALYKLYKSGFAFAGSSPVGDAAQVLSAAVRVNKPVR
ncbi:MAG: hypothetical protein HQL44_01475 [Alphaproteobacteria bacterium]|nr:hypothetical protein [Alphaproteobacteria bacterium]